MKAARFYGSKDLRVEDIDLPPMKEDEVKIDVEWCGICGSDKHMYTGTGRSNITPGHEFSGTVREIGSGVTNCKPGDRVVVNPLFSCGKCANCRQGYPNHCDHLIFFGYYETYGAFAEQAIVKDYMVIKIPDNLPLDLAALAEPTCIAAHALRICRFKAGDTAAVFGVGAIGLLAVSLLKAAGCTKIIAVGRTKSKRDLALKLGACAAIDPDAEDAAQKIQELTGGVDFAFEVSGAQQSFTSALSALRPRGELVIISLPGSPIEYDARAAVNREISILTSKCTNGEFPMVAELLASGAIDTTGVVTKKICLDDIVKEGFETLMNDRSQLKILVTPKRENLP